MTVNSASMETRLLRTDLAGAVDEAARLLKGGQLVVFPTDTVYGVGASVHDEAAIKQLFEVKQRPLAKGIPILLAEASGVNLVAVNIPEIARLLMTRYWPGPLTVIVPRRAGLPDILAPGGTVAVRVPDHPLTQRLIHAAGGAVAASSANLSGQKPALTAEAAMATLGGRIAAVLDGGPVHVGQASTIIDCTVTPPKILRRGPIPIEAVMETAASGL